MRPARFEHIDIQRPSAALAVPDGGWAFALRGPAKDESDWDRSLDEKCVLS
jgi:hypothetical protein